MMKRILPAVSFLRQRQKAILFGLLSGLFGAFFCLALYSEMMRPQSTDWLYAAGGDAAQHQIGWEFYRHSEWTWPLGVAKNYGYPTGIPVTYTDSIPLVAFVGKLFNSVLPDNFQYFGMWILLCFILQGVFGFILLKHFTKDDLVSFLGSIIFVLSPILHLRVHGHPALAAHWLILLSLWLVIRKHQQLQYWQWALVLFLGLTIHPYLFFMSGMLMAADVGYLTFQQKSLKWWQSCWFFLFQFILILAVSALLGLFYAGNGGAEGFGMFSMNLLALVNPMGWSNFLPSVPAPTHQMEGFNYLGLGVIIMLILSGISFLRQKEKVNFKINIPLAAAGVILTVFAISNVVMLGPLVIAAIPFEKKLQEDILGVLRSSGRMFWPVYYLIILVAFYFFKKEKNKIILIGVLLTLIFAQFYDLSDKFGKLDIFYENKTFTERMTAEFWRTAPVNYQHLSFIPEHANGYEAVARYAARNKLTLNYGYFARPLKGGNDHILKQTGELQRGIVRPDVIYFFSYDAAPYIKKIDLDKHLLAKANGFTILIPYFKNNYPDVKSESLGLELVAKK